MTNRIQTKHLILLTLILLLGATARMLHIDQQSIWADEGFAYFHSIQPSLALSLARDTHPPLYFGTLHIWHSITGLSELALRYFSLLPSMLSLAMVYKVARELVFARDGNPAKSPVPILAVLLLALADAEIFMAQELRHYTWHVFWVTASMWAMLRWCRTQNPWLWIAWVTLLTLGVYTHYITGFAGVVQGIFILLFLRGTQRIKGISTLVFSAGLLLPWLLIIGPNQVGRDGVYWSFDLSLALLDDIRLKWLGEQWALMLGLAILGIVTLVYHKNQATIQWRPLGTRVLLLMWAVFPLVFMILVNNFIPILSPRRLVQITPALALLIAFGLANIRPPIRGFLTAVIVIYSIFTVDFWQVKLDWRTVAQQTSPYIEADELALIEVGGSDHPMLYYWTRFLPQGTDIRHLKMWREFESESYFRDLPELMQEEETVWLMHWSPDTSAFRIIEEQGFINTAQFFYQHEAEPNIFVDLITYRYDRPITTELVSFENGMTLQSAEVDAEDLRVDLWWTTSTEVDKDYIVSAFILNEQDQLVAQLDTYPFFSERPTSTWETSTTIYDPRILQLAEGITELTAGDYTVGVKVYHFVDSGIEVIPTTDGDELYPVGKITLE